MMTRRLSNLSKCLLTMPIVMLGLAACATIAEGRTDTVRITSTPTGADVIVKDATGADSDMTCTTPCELELPRKVFRATVSQDGYTPFTYQIVPRTTFGRALVTAGGSYAALVDSRNGSDMTMSPPFVRVDLSPEGKRSVAVDKKGRIIKTLDYGDE